MSVTQQEPMTAQAESVSTSVAWTTLFPAELTSLSPARAAIEDTLRGRGWDERRTGDVVLAASEALTNAIEHGSSPGGWIELAVTVNGDRACLVVTDGGRDGAVALLPTPAQDVTGVRGHGLLIISRLAQTAQLRRVGAGIELRMELTHSVGCDVGASALAA
jgi:anti-sigma regulatory factor (Ser/Thr protein kinase)